MPFLKSPPRDLEDVNAPADPGVRLGLGHVQQVGQRARLHRQRELVHHLDRFPAQRLGQLLRDQRLHLRDHLGLLGALEERLDDGAILRVLRRIGLDRQLAHRADLLLRRNRHAKRRVRAEGLPILRRLAHVRVAQDHGNRLALERALKDAGVVPGFAKWIRDMAHGN